MPPSSIRRCGPPWAAALCSEEAELAVEFRDALPKTMVGKLSKKELVAEEKAKYEAAKSGGQQAAQ